MFELWDQRFNKILFVNKVFSLVKFLHVYNEPPVYKT